MLLTSDLIGPTQMRYALIKLLKLQAGVKLLSFNVLPARSITKNETVDNIDNTNSSSADKTDQAKQLQLYRHGIKIKLQGSYFQLRDYLTQLEKLSWKFFWQDFSYQLNKYPLGEIEIEIYSLSSSQEFIGV